MTNDLAKRKVAKVPKDWYGHAIPQPFRSTPETHVS